MTFGAVYLGMVLPVLFSGVTTRSAVAKQDQPAAVICVDPDYYREQAAHFRQLAGAISGDDLTTQMMELAAAYEAKAAQLEAQTLTGAHRLGSK